MHYHLLPTSASPPRKAAADLYQFSLRGIIELIDNSVQATRGNLTERGVELDINLANRTVVLQVATTTRLVFRF